MNLQLTGLVISFIITVMLGNLMVPILRRLKVGQIVRNDGPQSHLVKTGTPTMGGIIMLIPISIILLIFSMKFPKILLILFVTIGFGVVGFIDDYKKLVLKNSKGLSAKKKMIGLTIVSIIFVWICLKVFDLGTDIWIPIISQPFDLGIWIYIPFTIFVILASTNSLNLTDGLDGLAPGITTIIMTFFTIIAIVNNEHEMVIYGSVVTGACLGFLIFNISPAKVFMGDTGSLALGGTFSAIAIVLKMPLFLIFVALFCVIEAISVIIQVLYFKKTGGKRFFKMAPIHHHFELSGYKETTIVWGAWIFTIVLCICAYLIM